VGEKEEEENALPTGKEREKRPKGVQSFTLFLSSMHDTMCMTEFSFIRRAKRELTGARA